MQDCPHIAVIGAGIAGLSCARSLVNEGFAVTLFEKQAQVGGRVASTGRDMLTFDHGAQFLTAEGPAFSRLVAAAVNDGALQVWRGNFVAISNEGLNASSPSLPRLTGTGGIAAFPAWMAQGLTIHTGCGIRGMRRGAAGWYPTAEDGTVFGPFAAVAVAVPPPLAKDLLVCAPALADAAAAVRMTPCWSVATAFSQALSFPFDGIDISASPLARIARQSSKPGAETMPERWVLQADAAWSIRHLAADPAEICEMLVQSFRDIVQVPLPMTVHLQAHLWRHAQCEGAGIPLPLFDLESGVGVCGDWCLGTGIEGAFRSGRILALAMAEQLGAPITEPFHRKAV